MQNSVFDECRQVLRMRRLCNRRPKYFYMNGYDYSALYMEMQQCQLHTVTGLQREPLRMYPLHLTRMTVMGLEVVPFDLPQGYILCSETRLH